MADVWVTDLMHFLDEHNDILWQCSVCNDEGVIRNWQRTLWDCSQHGLTH